MNDNNDDDSNYNSNIDDVDVDNGDGNDGRWVPRFCIDYTSFSLEDNVEFYFPIYLKSLILCLSFFKNYCCKNAH